MPSEEVGIQVPGSSVRPGEDPADAALREAFLMAEGQGIWSSEPRHLRRCGILFFESRGKIRQDADGPPGREVTTGGEERDKLHRSLPRSSRQ